MNVLIKVLINALWNSQVRVSMFCNIGSNCPLTSCMLSSKWESDGTLLKFPIIQSLCCNYVCTLLCRMLYNRMRGMLSPSRVQLWNERSSGNMNPNPKCEQEYFSLITRGVTPCVAQFNGPGGAPSKVVLLRTNCAWVVVECHNEASREVITRV